MKKVILFAIFIFSFVRINAISWDQPIHLRACCLPANAGVLYATGSYLGNWNIVSIFPEAEEFFNGIPIEMFSSELDTCFIGTSSGLYWVKVIPQMDYHYLGLSHAKYVGEQHMEIWDFYDDEWNLIWFCYVTVDSADFEFNSETAELFYFARPFVPSEIYVAYFNADVYATGWIHLDYFEKFGCDYSDNPNEYCYALFCRVKAEAEDGGKAEISRRVNEIGDEITITATPDDGSTFQYWTEESTGKKITENPYTFTVTGKETYTACFGESSAVVLPDVSGNRNHNIYDLRGRKMSDDKDIPHGIYIRDGKKIAK